MLVHRGRQECSVKNPARRRGPLLEPEIYSEVYPHAYELCHLTFRGNLKCVIYNLLWTSLAPREQESVKSGYLPSFTHDLSAWYASPG